MANDTRMLSGSRQRKRDEYYTLYEDIADELSNYRDQFRGKHVICPCDWDESLDEVCVYASEEAVSGRQLFASGTVKTIDTGKSVGHIEKDVRLIKCNFVKYLVSHAEDWGIASVSVSGYNPATGEGVRFQDLDYSRYDICVTNPPFSQFIEFVDTMFRGNMRFVVIGPQDAVTYQSVFRHFMDNEMWLGYRYHLAGFIRPDGTRIGKQDNLARSCCWYTNMEVSYRNRMREYDSEYDPERYPQYDNYDVIHVPYSKDIPYDYDGPMGVPVTFLQKYCSRQFVLLGQTDNSGSLKDLRIPGHKKYDRPYLGGKRLFPRLVIQKRKTDE